MEPDPVHDSTLNEKVLVEEIVGFIKLIKQFKYSNLAQNPQILEIYKEKDLELNQRPNVWQTFIFSALKFNQKPFDTGKSVFDIIFMVIFCPYFSSKVPESISNSQSPKNNPTQQSQSQKLNKKNNHTYFRDNSNQIYDSVLKRLNRKQLPTIRQWAKQNDAHIKQSRNFTINKQETKALTQVIKTSKSIMTLEYVMNTNWYLVAICSKNMREQTDKKLLIHSIIRHDHYKFNNPTGFEYRIWLYLKIKFYASCTFVYTQSSKINSTKLLNLLIKTFMSSKIPHQENDIRWCMHGLHKTAEKYKNFLLADMIRSKCFWCEVERYSSNSIHKMRIYQCLSRKILNAISQQKKSSFQHSFVQQIKEKQNDQSLFDSQEQYQY